MTEISRTAAATPAVQLSPAEREARVLRYREKRKNRKFEKTIRYASRKAYADVRPRIKDSKDVLLSELIQELMMEATSESTAGSEWSRVSESFFSVTL